MFSLVLATALLSCAYGTRNLTVYSVAHSHLGPNYYAFPSYQQSYPIHHGVAAPVSQVPWASGFQPIYAYAQPSGVYPAGIPHAEGGQVYYGVAGQSVPSLRNIYDKPFILVARPGSGSEQMTACLVTDGLVSLEDNQCARHVHQAIRSGQDKKALLFYPRAYDVRRLYPAKNLNISKFEIPQNMTLKKFAQTITQEVPYLLVQDAQEFNTNVRTWKPVKIAEVDASLKPVEVYQYPIIGY